MAKVTEEANAIRDLASRIRLAAAVVGPKTLSSANAAIVALCQEDLEVIASRLEPLAQPRTRKREQNGDGGGDHG